MLRVKVRDSLVEVNGKPYSAVETFIHGKVTGKILVSKNLGVSGELLVGERAHVVYESLGVLIIKGDLQIPPGGRLEVSEHRRGLTVRVGNVKRDVYELLARFEEARIALSATFMPRRLMLHYDPETITLEEKPFSLNVYFRPPRVVREPKVA